MTIRERIDDDIKTLQVMLTDAETLEKRQAETESYEREVRELEKTILERERKLTLSEEELQKEKEGLSKKREELALYERKLEKSKHAIVEAGKAIKTMDEKIFAMKQEELLALEKKRKEIAGMQPVITELEKREALLKKEIGIDRKRKELLDLREEKIKRREQQLQMEATI